MQYNCTSANFPLQMGSSFLRPLFACLSFPYLSGKGDLPLTWDEYDIPCWTPNIISQTVHLVQQPDVTHIKQKSRKQVLNLVVIT
jgi:hypothetical protein